MKKQKSIVIIDGSNFYYKLKELNLPDIHEFNYDLFVSHLTKNTKLISCFYCIGKIMAKQNDVKARSMMAKQQSFVTKLQKLGFIIQFGYLLKSDNKFHEKGVDVQIAADILKGAYKDLYDTCFLVSSDSDLLPAITDAQSTGKAICYTGFRHRISYALLRTCKKHILFSEKDLLPFCTKK